MIDLKKSFDFFDKNSDGIISRSEFIELVDVLFEERALGESSAILRAFDVNGDGMIDYSEFASLVREYRL